jgi:putative oxidoreductase
MYDTGTEPKLLIPSLSSLYRLLVPLSWLLVRCAAGGILLVHGYAKIGHIDTVEGTMVRVGLGAPLFLAWVVTLTETVGAIAVVLGFFTRFFAAACAIDLAVIAFHVMAPRGFGTMEETLLWGLFFLAIALRGGGPFSIDRLIGREL